MFEQRRYRTTAASAVGMLELIHVTAVRGLREKHKSAVVGFVVDIVQTVAMLMVFYLLFQLLGLRGSAIRGDFMLFLMTGIFLYRTHIKSIGAIFSAADAVSGMMLHAPMNPVVAILGAAIGILYRQMLTVITLLFIYHAVVTPITIHEPVGAVSMVLLAWFAGCAIGLVLYSAKPWWPRGVTVFKSIYQRANVLASGKMFVANTMPGFVLQWFTWNPLFHTIDQARGFTFINYNPHYSSVAYPFFLSLTLIMIGLLVEFFTRRRVSVSWRSQGV
ncbi:MAG: ABC transporter permease [Paracoccaceae bacterium]|nr:ABC transporter permease [Paracoccaceae bacterium]